MERDEKHNRLVDEFLAPKNSVSLALLVVIGSAIWGAIVHWTTPPQWLSVIIILGIIISSPWILVFPRRVWPHLVHTWGVALEEHRNPLTEVLIGVAGAKRENINIRVAMKLPFQLLIFVAALLLLFLSALAVGARLGLEQSALAPICSAVALATSAVVAYWALQLNRRNSQEPWVVTFRELHKEFWNDPKLATVRQWICCDEAYAQVKPIFEKRLAGEVSMTEYPTLEAFDRFCALMLRIVQANLQPMTAEQNKSWEDLGYSYWLDRLKGREAFRTYVECHWEELIKLHLSSPGRTATGRCEP